MGPAGRARLRTGPHACGTERRRARLPRPRHAHAFSAPGRILTQVAEMPDGKRYFWVARTITRGGFGHHAPRAEFAVALGCELRHAHRLVYAEGIALDDPRAATPIGLGCRICERRDCAQRARPPAGGRLAIDPDRRTYVLVEPRPAPPTPQGTARSAWPVERARARGRSGRRSADGWRSAARTPPR
ncbi:short-chain fatty acyl-CoA regulator family protein [Streptomyces spinoverrucosus]|uniref:short-chain fatty acyl-CoA regulator family protein n=1 Tax=Streptomyces spinoverrucosus TaxID=284043 RepID=UPI0027DA8FDB|nr:short-chain fatty acyl-CoA regulator family protein [Streptomyces spinoverrucosus]